MKGVVTSDTPVHKLSIGNIIDAQDYLGSWHLSIVIDEEGPQKWIHFIKFTKANRNEPFTPMDDDSRVLPAFSKSEPDADPFQQIETLR